jgi:hypothetical protein
MILSSGHIKAMVEGLRRIRRAPQKEWLSPIIERLEALQPGERLIIERIGEP